MAEARHRVEGLDVLRGFASLAVCWFHLTKFHYNTPDPRLYHLLCQSGAYGWLGVEIFFVISGFVIPYSLYQARYRLRDYFRYILRRVVRLDPPYLAAIAVILLLAYITSWHSGRPAQVEEHAIGWVRVLLHLGYLNIFTGYASLNPGFWTLAVEIQYYLLMGLLFPLVVTRNRAVRLVTVALMMAINVLFVTVLVPNADLQIRFVPTFLCLFLLGILTFQFRVGFIRAVEYVPALVLVAATSVLTLSLADCLAGLVAVAVILAYRGQPSAVSRFFANISYSLYLLHWPVGHHTLSVIGMKYLKAESDAARTFVLFLTLVVCVISAYVLYIAVERPAQMWAKRFRYGAA
jgi:peptidoglycan/LPS O-acetylase OafA/YrhL